MSLIISGLLVNVLALLIKAVGGLKLTELLVPDYVDRGASAKLACNFDTEYAKLYSVKWYKDEFEFFRFMPGNKPQSQVFPLEGISLDESVSGINHVMLTNLQFSSTGSYRCEVSTEAPNFATIFLSKTMTVLAYPHDEPKLEGYQETYAIYDDVVCNCTAAPSNPAPSLQWYINNLKADEYLVQLSPLVKHPDNTSSMSAMLKFSAQRQHFLGTAGLLTLRCDAVASPLDTVSTSITARLQGAFTNQKLAQGDFRKSEGRFLSSTIMPLVLTFLLLST